MNTLHRLAILIMVSLATASCTAAGQVPSGPTTTATAAPLAINVDGQAIVLEPGINILPEIYEAAQSPELLENVEWVLVDGYWDIMPKGVTIPLEVVEPSLEAAPPFPGFPESWASAALPGSVLTFDYPADWQLEMMEPAVQLFPADGAFWISVESHENSVNASLAVWLAEYGPDLPGDLLAQYDETIAGKPAIRQQVIMPESDVSRGGETIFLWITHYDRVLQWTAWPGDQPETYDLLTHMTSTLR